MPVAGHLDQVVIEVRNAFGALQDLIVGDDIIKHNRRIVDDVTNDMGIRAGVDRLGERPGLNPGFQLRNRDQRQQRHVRATALDGVQQRLVLQVAEEDVLFVFRQSLEIDTVAGNVNLFRAPEEGELLFNQLFEDVIFLLIVACHVDRLAEEHRLFELVVFRL